MNLNQMMLLLFVLILQWFGSNKTVSALGNQTDHSALLKFKESITKDPNGILVSWNSSTHFCNWHGVTCSSIHQRVRELNLSGYQLHGLISPHVGNLSFLRNLNLENNSFYGEIPQELGRLFRLQLLLLNNNSLAGGIPTNLTSCSQLKGLYLCVNNLIGRIPTDIGSLRKLQAFGISRNNLIGPIPPSMWNLFSLRLLSAGYNNLEGTIPQEIGLLKNLTILSIYGNKLFGTLPSSLYNISSLMLISITGNQFNGSLPPNMFLTLPNLQEFRIGRNQISGPIPTSLTNESILGDFDITHNYLVGQVPNLEKLHNLRVLALSSNNLGDNSTKDLEFLETLTNCSKLQIISIAGNYFGGTLPNALGNLSSELDQMYLGDNQIFGNIPAELGNLVSLTLLTMENNHFEGVIPVSFGKFQKLQVLDLRTNKLSGNIPTIIGNLSQLFWLKISQTLLDGHIPPSIGNCQKLQYLDLSQNNLRGIIPPEIMSISSLTSLLNLSRNSLSGGLPSEVGRLESIGRLDVSENNLYGDIPETIGECTSLEYLYLEGNSFNGAIPSSMASLKGLRHLDLSRNHLSGSIPEILQNISGLEYLNISFNMLDGKVPIGGVFGNASQVVLTGNINLCGGILELHLPPCPIKDKKQVKHHNFKVMAAVVSAVAFLLILSSLLSIYWMRKRNKKLSLNSQTIDQFPKVSYRDLHRGTDGFSDRNFIGSGNFGTVYKGTLESEDSVVAVKVLNLQNKGAQKSFIAECGALKNIRHRNLVKLVTCCSSTDYKGWEFKALVFEYMTNGSLERWLHPATEIVNQPRSLDLVQRLNIIIDVASAIRYLHHECEQPVIHCDLKPSNVLLDDDMVAHVSDFGLARLVSTINGTSHNQTSTSGIKGTVGYAPPEYGVGSKVSTQGDVYSFGILVLEMLTGRRPTDEMLKDGQNLHNFVKFAISDNLLQILDPSLVPRDVEAEAKEAIKENLTRYPTIEKCLASLLKIGLACSMELPKERINMMDVTRELNIIRKAFFADRVNGD